MTKWLLILSVAVLAGCGGDAAGNGVAEGPAVAWVDPDGDAPHIGSLSVNPADGSLLLGSNTVVAPLFGQGQIQLSRDGGVNFESRVAPTALVDLAVDPGDGRRWVATSDQGIYVTVDEGRSWRRRDNTPNVRLAWQDPRTLYRIDPGGAVKVSGDGGESWQDRGRTGGEPQALTVDPDGTLVAASLDGVVKRSQDGGASWTDLVRP